MTENDKRTLQTVLRIMQENDRNGEYYSYLEDIETGALQFEEVVIVLLSILKQWHVDLGKRDKKQKLITKCELQLAAML